MKPGARTGLAGDLWGGLAAMLVALPSAIAFGVTIFAPLGGGCAAQGAVAGMIGATVLGLVAAAVGGTDRLISAPCAPAAAVLSALAVEMAGKGRAGEAAMLSLALVGLLSGGMQVAFGAARLGRLIRYMPYPVVSGYLTGVGLILIAGQAPRLLGTPRGTGLWEALATPSLWSGPAIGIGAVTIAAVAAAPRITRAVPPAILGLAAGALAFAGFGLADRSLFAPAGNPLVVGPLGTHAAGFLDAFAGRWKAASALAPADLGALLVPALTLAALLSIDTLKTCVVLDTLTRSRHRSDRTLIGQGLGNLAACAAGGVPGAGQMGATLVALSGGAATRRAGLTAGALALAAVLALGGAIAWVPIPALAGLLIAVGARMLDRDALHLARSRDTLLDFAVILAVVLTAQLAGLVPATGVGVGLAILLFLREQARGSVVRRRIPGNRMFSKLVRRPEQMAILERRGAETVVFELQGALFFGTAEQLYAALEPDLAAARTIVLDMRRVQSLDVTAAHVLEQIEDTLTARGATLVFAHFPRRIPSGRDLVESFDRLGLARPRYRVRLFPERNLALEWIEDRILEEEHAAQGAELPLELADLELFRGRSPDTLAALETAVARRSFRAGEKVFTRGEPGDEMFIIRRGAVRILLPLDGGATHHLATIGRGSFFGEMTFLDREPRSADAVAHADTDVFALSRARFDALTAEHKRLGMQLLEGLARALAVRLRRADTELRALQEG